MREVRGRGKYKLAKEIAHGGGAENGLHPGLRERSQSLTLTLEAFFLQMGVKLLLNLDVLAAEVPVGRLVEASPCNDRIAMELVVVDVCTNT